MRNLAGAILCAAALAGCTTPQEAQQTKMQLALGQEVGRSIADYVADHGYPTDSVKLSDRESSYRWVLTATGNGAVVPLGGSYIIAPPRQLVCTVILKAHTTVQAPELKDWTITDWSWQGNC